MARHPQGSDHFPEASMSELARIAAAMAARGKGILAADESTGTIEKRFKAIGVENTEENRRAYRDMLFTTKGLGEHISGVILYDETLRQKASDGTPFAQLLAMQGVIPGIKVDTGAKPMALCPGELVTEGLDNLAKRCAEYVKLGAKFAKWRAVINIGNGIPSQACIVANAHALARYAAICQGSGLVPIVEPEVLMDGAHGVERCEEVAEWTLREVFAALASQRVTPEEMVLKPSMVVSGSESRQQAGVAEVAQRTLKVLRRTVPAAVPGIAFLSGGQSDERATEHLDAMNRLGGAPWALTFSYGRALQQPSLKAWRGSAANVAAAQAALAHRARMNGLAAMGQYRSELEKKAA
ncbi:MAG: fructose-bisphosphate aldolase [Betaproteobacteria bacterium RIFCSPLOWO2_02_FULL_65_24]|nr:MAG: fructose-bisphosphate aldolase [Betaproteobacteria bacterium RIFCSPLOWO2_02_FULL_65_24]OGA95795.1 MAG: fructose-bisphosphate aldolase [Betaproteobacteria bacterium RIFCSPLOWO2_12_FULL_66_14]